MTIPPLAKTLPQDAALRLQRAALTLIPENVPLTRVRAIEKAIERVKSDYPQYFKKEH